jgi:hypothetical protein
VCARSGRRHPRAGASAAVRPDSNRSGPLPPSGKPSTGLSRPENTFDPRRGQRIAVCTVEDAFAHTGMYVVRPPVGPLSVAVDTWQCSMLPMGVRPVGTYSVKTQVVVLYDPDLEPSLLILGALPPKVADGRLPLPDSIVLRSRTGFFEDPMHFQEFVPTRNPLGNHSAGRPADALPGMWGYITDTGLAVCLAPDMALLRASDLAKVELFRGDSLLRLQGYNTELWTAGREDRLCNDRDEYVEMRASSMFPWEALGIAKRKQPAAEMRDGRLKPGSEDAAWEPKKKDQLLIPRHLVLGGYLGDVEREFVSFPPDDLEIETYEAETKHVGGLDIIKGSDGTYVLRAARSISVWKHGLIAVPKRLHDPEDPKGDNEDNYKPAGEDTEVADWKWGDDNAGIPAAQLTDWHAYLCNRYFGSGLVKHKKDWYWPEETDLTKPVDAVVYGKNLKFGHQFQAELPGAGDAVTVDHRPGHKVTVFKTSAGWDILPDGGIVLTDGWGSQLVMSGGNIFLRCAGDVWAQPGRNFIAWAPHDAVLRAGNSAEVTAAKKDVRLKAEGNVHVLGGNGGQGGVLIESRAEGPVTASGFEGKGEEVESAGVVVKTAKSGFYVLCKDGYVSCDPEEGGRLILDAGKRGKLLLRGDQVSGKVFGAFNVLIEDEAGGEQQAVRVDQGLAVVSVGMEIDGSVEIGPGADGNGGSLVVSDSLVVNSNGLFGGSVAVNGGFAAVEGAPFVGTLDKPIRLPRQPGEVHTLVRRLVTAVDQVVKPEEKAAVEEADTSPGHVEFRRKVGFSCRPTEQVGLKEDDFKLYEGRWQQMLRSKGAAGEPWDEPEVKAPDGDPGRPHPGHEAWERFNALIEVDEQNVTPADGRAKPRADLKAEGKAGRPVTLKAKYIVNIQQ